MSTDLDGLEYDPMQLELMKEELIVVDYNDKPIGQDSKKTCHLMENINPPKSLLHRAFSVFLFDPKNGKLLMQKRAPEKITFPNMWTNTCCSHPLYVPQEMVEEDVLGVRRAAQRKLTHELGIPASQVPLSKFLYLTRIHYLAPSSGLWGEHEIDYILFCSADVTLEANQNEVCDTVYVSKEELEEMFKQESNQFTPWFKLIAQSFLYKWWDALLKTSQEGAAVPDNTVDVGSLSSLVTEKDRNEIHRMVKDTVQVTKEAGDA